jgi:hypothetical protein
MIMAFWQAIASQMATWDQTVTAIGTCAAIVEAFVAALVAADL